MNNNNNPPSPPKERVVNDLGLESDNDVQDSQGTRPATATGPQIEVQRLDTDKKEESKEKSGQDGDQFERDEEDEDKNDGEDIRKPRDTDENQQRANTMQQPQTDKKNEQAQPEGQQPESSDPSNVQMADTSAHINKNLFVAQQRSNLLTKNDRHQIEKDVMKQLNSGAGLFGTSKINLDAQKKKICTGIEQKDLPQNDKLVKLLQQDGLFVDSSLMFNSKDINVQKLEERLLNCGQVDYFKYNGQLKINNDILADEFTRPADLAFEQSDAYQTIENNAIVTDRLNSYKKQYYSINIIVGKIILKQYMNLLEDEDHMMLKLKNLCKIYDRRVSLALIPFLMEKEEYLKEQINNKTNDPNSSIQDSEFLSKMYSQIKTDLEEEKTAINEAANQIYQQWTEIKKKRAEQGFTITPYELKVFQGPDEKEVLFNLNQTQVNEGEALIKNKKKKINNTTGYCKLIIDGKYVTQTAKSQISWPNFELDILDQFDIHVFTLPSSVQLEIVIGDKMVDILDLIIPGSHVKTLTSAARMIKEYTFSRKNHFIDQKKKRGVNLEKDDINKMTKEELESLKRDIPNIDKVNVEGVIFIKAEWSGFGDQMPPARSETLFSLSQLEKNRNHFTKQEQFDMLQEEKPLDVNDPRNELIIKHMRNMKNDYLDRLLSLDTKFQLYDIQSFRHHLLKARASDPNFAKIPIPQLNNELINADISKFYLDWLEDVHRQETWKAYQNKRATTNQNLMDDQRIENDQQVFDTETLGRRRDIFEKINKRKKQNQSGIKSNKQAQYDSVVSEFTLTEAEASILSLIKNLFQYERKLKPKIKKRKQCAIDSVDKAKLLIHVIRGTDVPVRQSFYHNFLQYISDINDGGQDNQDAYKQLYSLKQVETFLEIRLYDPETKFEKIQKTCVAEGQCPEWNELLEFMLVAKNGVAFTKDELEQSKMMVYFTLFDQEVKVDQITKMNRLLQKQNRYLGSFKVPLTTILSNSKFEGLIKLQRPLILQDYHVVQDELIFMDKEDIEKQQNRNEEQIPTYINLSISIEPFIKLPMENDKDYYNGKEKANFLEACIQWAKATARPFVLNQRCFKLFLENIDGQSVFIPRFLSPIKPPDEIYKKDDSRAIERAARFVSLIPFMDDAQLFKDMPDITCTSQEFLDLGSGDSEEHAMLLCNFFNFIDKDQGRQAPGKNYHSYIIYGEAIPDGACWYVLRRDIEHNFVEIWNPMTAEVYNFDLIISPARQVFGRANKQSMNQRTNDPQCTMRKIWTIVGQENVWANIQKEEAPVLIRYDLENLKNWKPFLDKRMRNEYFSGNQVQNIHLQTGAPNLKFSKPKVSFFSLEDQLRKYLIGKFEDERIEQVKKTTNWNIQVGEALEKILQADNDLQNEYGQDVQDRLDPTKNQSNQRKRQSNNKFNPTGITYQKYYPDKNMINVLKDFEEYISCARNGGTIGKMRDPKQNKDEDIRATIVQQFVKEIGKVVQKKVWAIPINCSFIDENQIWETVKNTRMHEFDNQDVEFSLSVVLKGYPCNVISVWIYIAMFTDDFDIEEN